MTAIGRPAPGEYGPYFERYIGLVPETDVLAAMERQLADVAGALGGVSEARAGFRYAEGKWSLRQVAGHLADTERLFAYRALCIARGETISLPAFDENAYVDNAAFDEIAFRDLVEEFLLARRSHLLLFRGFSPEAWTRIGTANGLPASPRALAYNLVGHVRHHLKVAAERYLPGAGA